MLTFITFNTFQFQHVCLAIHHIYAAAIFLWWPAVLKSFYTQNNVILVQSRLLQVVFNIGNLLPVTCSPTDMKRKQNMLICPWHIRNPSRLSVYIVSSVTGQLGSDWNDKDLSHSQLFIRLATLLHCCERDVPSLRQFRGLAARHTHTKLNLGLLLSYWCFSPRQPCSHRGAPANTDRLHGVHVGGPVFKEVCFSQVSDDECSL